MIGKGRRDGAEAKAPPRTGGRRPPAGAPAGRGGRRGSRSESANVRGRRGRSAGRAGEVASRAGANRRRSLPENRKPSPPPRPKVSLRERVGQLRARCALGFARVRRPLLITGRLLVVLAVVAGSVAVGRLVDKHVRTSPAFATKKILVAGNARLTRAEVLKAAGLAMGKNVFAMSPEDARARLSAHPWIASAQVTRRLPDTYVVHVRERQAAAVLSIDGLYLVSDEGTVFKRVGPNDPVDLPVITGVDRDRFTSDRAWRTSVLLEVVALLHDYRGEGLWGREPISEVHVEADDGLSLYAGAGTSYVRLGRGPYRGKLRRFRSVLDALDAKKAQAAYVYLDNVRRPDRVTVRLR